MTKKQTSPRKNKIAAFVWSRKVAALVFLALFLLGYNLTVARLQPSFAQQVTAPQPVTDNTAPPTVVMGFCPAGYCFPEDTMISCEAPGTAQAVTDSLIENLLQDLRNTSNTLENWLFSYMNNVMLSAYDTQQWFELKMMQGWDTFWYYDFLPGLQSMTRQLNAGLAQQAFQIQADTDATLTMEVGRALSKHEQQDRGINGGAQMCVAATMSGGFTRTEVISHDMRIAWEQDSLADGLNEKTDGKGNPYPGASSSIGSYVRQYEDYLNIFCDPNGNGGENYCLNSTKLNPALYNADVEPVKYIYNNLTIPVDQEDNPNEYMDVETAVYDIINNMVGIPAAEPMAKPALASVIGHQEWLSRRSYLSRYAAIRSVPDLIASWRMPGSGKALGQVVGDLRKSALGATQNAYTGPASLINGYVSKNPSYKEIMHAVSIDQFNSGKFALGMITNKNRLQMEKLNLSVFYLMQLRDYYALLERTALTLAVQVSLRDEAEMHALQNVYAVAPVK